MEDAFIKNSLSDDDDAYLKVHCGLHENDDVKIMLISIFRCNVAFMIMTMFKS